MTSSGDCFQCISFLQEEERIVPFNGGERRGRQSGVHSQAVEVAEGAHGCVGTSKGQQRWLGLEVEDEEEVG
jgi:hypothetical protein